MTHLDTKAIREACEKAPRSIELQFYDPGPGPTSDNQEPSPACEAFYDVAITALPAAIARVEELEREVERLRRVYEATKTWCETIYIGKPHPRYPAYPGDEMLLAVNAIRFAAGEK